MDDNWAPAQNQFEYGLVDLDFQREDWPISIAVQVLLTYSDQVPEIEGVSGDYSGTYEFNLGLRKIWRRQKKIPPFEKDFNAGGLHFNALIGYHW
jgi:hypothetical protein